jgi:dTDP-4-dehydrorhamnose reductase
LKILITGAKGQLGAELTQVLSGSHEVFGFGHQELDITNLEQVLHTVQTIQPDLIIHAAAYTDVDRAETEVDQAFLVNAYGTRNIVLAARVIQAKLVYISTDYVFDGSRSTPYHEFVPPSPLNVYGQSKLAGEQLVQTLLDKYFIVRTSWLFGKAGHNFVKTMLNLSKEKKELYVVDDQIGSPTYTLDLAHCIQDLIRTQKYGIYHVTNSGSCSWYTFAIAIFEESGISVTVHPITTNHMSRPALRPAYSVLDPMALRLNGFPALRGWREALQDYLKNQDKA